MITKKIQYPEINADIVKEHGLSDEEYANIVSILDRQPNYVELGVYSVMWSEHCSYKSSIRMIKTLLLHNKLQTTLLLEGIQINMN